VGSPLTVAVLSWLGGSPAPSQLCRPSAWGKPHLFRPTAVRMEQATASKQIQVGATLPEVEVDVASAESVDPAFERIGTVLGPGRSILLGMPGAFTPACTDVHLPGFLRAADTFADCAIDKIVVCTANDRWTNDAWANAVTANACGMLPVASESGSNVEYVADARGDLLEDLGMIAYLGRSMGVRSRRFALIAEDGVVKHVAVDAGSADVEKTSASALLPIALELDQPRRASLARAAETAVSAELYNRDASTALVYMNTEGISLLRAAYVDEAHIQEAMDVIRDAATRPLTEALISAEVWAMSAPEAFAYLEAQRDRLAEAGMAVEEIEEAVAIVNKAAGGKRAKPKRDVASGEVTSSADGEVAESGGTSVALAALLVVGVGALAIAQQQGLLQGLLPEGITSDTTGGTIAALSEGVSPPDASLNDAARMFRDALGGAS